MIIRPANLADCAGLARVQVDSYRSAYTGIQPPEYLDHFTSVEQEGRCGTVACGHGRRAAGGAGSGGDCDWLLTFH